MKRYKFKVKSKHTDGALDFPMDMLRYDRCYPTTPQDARAIGVAAHKQQYPFRGRKPFKGTIELQSNDRQPSSAAWDAHGWLVTNIESFRQ